MKVALLAGGLGTRLMEETTARPKPMVEIGGQPILHHIMRLYAGQGFRDFVVALGYKGEVIRDYFSPPGRKRRLSVAARKVDLQPTFAPDWNIELVGTGDKTMTGGRLRRLAPELSGGTFMLTYGDGLSDVDLSALLAFHRSHGRLATLTAVHPPERSTRVTIEGKTACGLDRNRCGEGWINGGFFVFEPGVFEYLSADSDSLESVALTALARDGQLMAYRHDGFWQCMDTVIERDLLESMWQSSHAPWMTLGVTASRHDDLGRASLPALAAGAD